MLMLVPPPPSAPLALYDLIYMLGLQSSLTWVIDPGDVRSFAGASDQTLQQLPGGSPVWTRGVDASVDTDRDVSFVGTINRQSRNEYFDCGQVSGTPTNRLESAIASWSNAAHQNNAAFTFAACVRVPSSFDGCSIFLNALANTDVGVAMAISAAAGTAPGKLVLDVDGAIAPSWVYRGNGNTIVPRDSDVFIAWSINEAANQAIFQVNGTQDVTACTYTSPSAAATTYKPFLSVADNVTVSSRLYNSAWWGRALSAAELTRLYQSLKPKFGF